MRAPARIWRWGLAPRLFLSYLLVIAVVLITLWVAVNLVAPNFFDAHVIEMLATGSAPVATAEAQVASEWREDLDQLFRATLTQALVVSSAIAVVLAASVSLFVAGKVANPLRRLARSSERIAAGHYTERAPVIGEAEIQDLAISFNEMASRLEATERRRMDLIGDVAHELRTPLSTLEGYLEAFLDGVVEPNQETWGRLHGETRRLKRLVDDLQELSRTEASQVAFSLAATSPGKLVAEAVAALTPEFDEKNLRLDVIVPVRLPAVYVDRDRAIQALTNLLTNALRYTASPGTVRLQVEQAGGMVRIIVADTGIGIPPEHLPYVFERFYRVDKSRSRAGGGSGIGLTIARSLVEAMGGTVSVHSPGPGRGSTFGISFPRAV